MLIERATKEQSQEEISKNGIVVMDFFADWCGPCQMFLPVFHEVGKANEETYITVNVDEQGEYANEMNVQGIPTIIVFKDGKEATRTAGFLSPEQLNELVNSVK